MGSITLGPAAIKDSGIVPSHIQPIYQVAKSKNAFIMVRAVNEWATGLIAESYNTKGLHVKGKSSDWGPQAGFICVDQGLSKLARKELSAVPEFNGKVEKSIEEGDAVPVRLVISRARIEELAKRGKIKITSEDQSVMMVTATDVAGYSFELRWLPAGHPWLKDAGSVIAGLRGGGYMVLKRDSRHGTAPVMVLADTETKVPLTADYDLYAIAPRIQRAPVSGGVSNARELIGKSFDPNLGKHTGIELSVVHAINGADRTAGYKGNAVCHHGPEVNNPFPEQDWPVTVFSPVGRVFGVPDQATLEEVVGEIHALDFHFHINPKYDHVVRKAVARKLARLAILSEAHARGARVGDHAREINQSKAFLKLDPKKHMVFQDRRGQVGGQFQHLGPEAAVFNVNG